tara:strand:+ start:2070 stop:2624 length:555 start_codon:yes stop_codon:yes gene_type:complete
MWVKQSELDRDKAHYAFLKQADSNELWCIKYLYDRLNIIDSKIGAILRLNGLGIGFMSVLVFQILRSIESCSAGAAGAAATDAGIAATCQPLIPWPGIFLLMAAVIFVLLFAAVYLGLTVFYLRFDRIGDAVDFDAYKERFFRLTIERERKLRWALNLTGAGLLVFVTTFLIIAVTRSLPLLGG